MTNFATLDELYGNDEERNTTGAPVEIGINKKNEPIVIYIAEAGNENHIRAMRKYERALESSRHNSKKRRMLNSKIIAESILVNWSGILDEKGKPVPANLKNKIDALMHSRQFMGEVIDASQDRGNFVDLESGIDVEKESEKN